GTGPPVSALGGRPRRRGIVDRIPPPVRETVEIPKLIPRATPRPSASPSVSAQDIRLGLEARVEVTAVLRGRGISSPCQKSDKRETTNDRDFVISLVSPDMSTECCQKKQLNDLLQGLFQSGFGHRADNLFNYLARFEDEQRWNRAHPVLLRRFLVLVDVELGHLDLAFV